MTNPNTKFASRSIKVKVNNRQNEKSGFTIVELLTVMSIIILLIGLLVPALNRVRRYALRVKQKAQFHSISIALDMFNAEYEGYPDSNERDDLGQPYCGAMKLCEAMVGQDLKGFHPKSRFRVSGFLRPNVDGTTLYPATADWPTSADYIKNVRSRKMYLQLENANAFQLDSIYDVNSMPSELPKYKPYTFVLCDVYNRVTNRHTGRKMGMPILYYKADSTKTQHKYYANPPEQQDKNIYDTRDNQGLVDLGLPWISGPMHPMAWGGFTTTGALATPQVFYDETVNPNIPGGKWPYRNDSYILFSAGFDGEYGTSDDVFNFGD